MMRLEHALGHLLLSNLFILYWMSYDWTYAYVTLYNTTVTHIGLFASISGYWRAVHAFSVDIFFVLSVFLTGDATLFKTQFVLIFIACTSTHGSYVLFRAFEAYARERDRKRLRHLPVPIHYPQNKYLEMDSAHHSQDQCTICAPSVLQRSQARQISNSLREFTSTEPIELALPISASTPANAS